MPFENNNDSVTELDISERVKNIFDSLTNNEYFYDKNFEEIFENQEILYPVEIEIVFVTWKKLDE